MKFERYRRGGSLAAATALALALALPPHSVRANVYATNVRLNGSVTNLTVFPGTPINISYVLNEPASLGVTIQIAAGTNLARTLVVPAGGLGATLGTNTVVWDGLDGSSNAAPQGIYSISVTPSSSGYTNWTQTTDDDNPGNYLLWGLGIGVDKNTNSPHFGRIFIANSFIGGSPATTYGDNLGILAFNADATIADPTMSVTGGYGWTGNYVSPWKVEVSSDDFVYASELVNGGRVYRWDTTISTNSFLPVLRPDNVPGSASLSGPLIVGSGTNTWLWMADTNTGSPAASRGVLRWLLSTNGACATNDPGQTMIAIGGSLTNAPFDVSLDPAGNIYVCQYTSATNDPIQRVFRFKAFDPSTNGGAPELTADWAIGSGDDTFGEASAIAVDPTGTYVAVAFQGASPPGVITNGNTKIFYATNGALVANLDLGVEVNGVPTHQDTDCGWDTVGNLYYIDNWLGRWRAVSPPGTNHATTVALATVQVVAPPPPVITAISYSGGTVTINFTAGVADRPSSFVVLGAALVTGPYSAVAAQITSVSPGLFRAVLTNTASIQFYDVRRQSAQPPQPPRFTSLTVSNSLVTLNFTGATNDVPGAFTLQSAGRPTGSYTNAANASIIGLGAGLFRATVPVNGAVQFYRLKR